MLGSYCCGRSYCLHVTCEDGWTRASAGYTCTQFLSFFWGGGGCGGGGGVTTPMFGSTITF